MKADRHTSTSALRLNNSKIFEKPSSDKLARMSAFVAKSYSSLLRNDLRHTSTLGAIRKTSANRSRISACDDSYRSMASVAVHQIRADAKSHKKKQCHVKQRPSIGRTLVEPEGSTQKLFNLPNSGETASLSKRITSIEVKVNDLATRLQRIEYRCIENVKSEATVEKEQADIEGLKQSLEDVLAQLSQIGRVSEVCKDNRHILERKIFEIRQEFKLDAIHHGEMSDEPVMIFPEMDIQGIGMSADRTKSNRHRFGSSMKGISSSAMRSQDDVTFIVDDDLYLLDKNGNYLHDDEGEKVKIQPEDMNRVIHTMPFN